MSNEGNPSERSLVGVGGWLILLEVGLVAVAVQSILFLIEPGLTTGQVALHLVSLFGSACILYLLFSKSVWFPKVLIAWIWTQFALVLVASFAVVGVSGADVARDGAVGLVWTMYVLKSKRVSATFVRRERATPTV